MHMKKIVALLLCIAVVFSLGSCGITELFEQNSAELSVLSSSVSDPAEESENDFSDSETITVHFLDVGQGDSIFIELPEHTCMLIDASEAKYAQNITDSIKSLGYSKLDYVIATHPHADHIGGMKAVLSAFEVGCIYMPDASATTTTYTRLVEYILEKKIDTYEAKKGVVVFDEEDLKARFLAPETINEKDQNKNSAVLYLEYKEKAFIFTGDADSENEKTFGTDIRCDVLKVGHHGSRTASSEAFLNAAKPKYAIISCGEGNSYGHPHDEAVERLTNCGATILRTDLLGTICVITDGYGLKIRYGQEEIGSKDDTSVDETTSIASEQTSEEVTSEETSKVVHRWMLNTSSKKIHLPDCRHVQNISEKNYAESEQNLNELIAAGYSICGTCKPSEDV